MSKAQEAVLDLLGGIPVDELSSDEHRTVLDVIKRRLESAPDLEAELRLLYKVQGFSDFALCLMWLARQAEAATQPELATTANAALVFSTFQRALGGGANAPIAGSPGSVVAVGIGEGESKAFSSLLEQFVEAIQSGDDRRVALLEEVVKSCELHAAGEFAEDFRLFCSLLAEFLRYILENQLLDDIRVLNILSNIASPVVRWEQSAPEARVGLFEEEINLLRDFKSHFE
jgi:hypothetical protein